MLPLRENARYPGSLALRPLLNLKRYTFVDKCCTVSSKVMFISCVSTLNVNDSNVGPVTSLFMLVTPSTFVVQLLPLASCIAPVSTTIKVCSRSDPIRAPGFVPKFRPPEFSHCEKSSHDRDWIFGPKKNPVTPRRPGGEPGRIFFRGAAGRGRDWIFFSRGPAARGRDWIFFRGRGRDWILFSRGRRRGVVTGFLRDWIFGRS